MMKMSATIFSNDETQGRKSFLDFRGRGLFLGAGEKSCVNNEYFDKLSTSIGQGSGNRGRSGSRN